MRALLRQLQNLTEERDALHIRLSDQNLHCPLVKRTGLTVENFKLEMLRLTRKTVVFHLRQNFHDMSVTCWEW